MVKCMKGLVEFGSTTDDRKVALSLNQACSNERVGKAVEKMWQHRYLIPIILLLIHCYVPRTFAFNVTTTSLTIPSHDCIG